MSFRHQGLGGRIAAWVVGWCAVVSVTTNATPPSADDRSDLRVLFVGHDPADPQVAFAQLATERTWELYKERTAAFEALLREHFKHVQVVFAAEYTVGLSDSVDVTLFDARPPQLRPAGQVEDPETGLLQYQRASYLPEHFDRPALMVAENSPLIGEPLGLKLDWL